MKQMENGSSKRTVCLTCGDEGDTKLLIFCLKCRDSAAHHYCLEKFPVDDDNINWICWDCAPKVDKVELLRKSERIIVRKTRAIDVRMQWRRKLNNCKLKAKRLDNAKYDASGAVQSYTTHGSFQVFQKKSEYHETKENKDIREQCEDVCDYFEQKIESVKTGNSPAATRQEAYCSTLNEEEGEMEEERQFGGKSSLQDPKSAQSLLKTEKQLKMRKPRRRFVVLDDDSDFEGEGVAIGGNISPLVSDEHYSQLINSCSDLYLGSVNYLPAQPVVEPVWRGCFNFSGESETSINILAHLSNKACEKASEAANRLPVELDVIILAKRDVWPNSFQMLPPTEDSIALYLFPELEGDENTYDAVLDDVIDNDLAMNTTIDDNLELLIFSSRELPQKQWRICRKYYLWGVSRHKRRSSQRTPEAANLLNAVVPNCGMDVDTEKQDVEMPGKCRIQASDTSVVAQKTAPVDDFGPCLDHFDWRNVYHLQQRGRLLTPMFILCSSPAS